MRWLRGKRREPGWLAVSLRPDSLSFAHARASGERAALTRCGAQPLEGEYHGAERVGRELELDRFQCVTLLAPGEYQLLLVDAPNVPPAELKTAIRWRIKDMIDFHADDATVDVLDIPPDPAAANRQHSMYAVVAKNEVIQERIGRFDAARIPLSVIDIPETAQRNLASPFEPEGRGVALLYVSRDHALLTINFGKELYLARRIDTGLDQILAAPPGGRDEPFNRIVLELQRTLDHFDRQFRFVSVAKLLLGPEPEDTGLEAFLASNLDLPVERIRLGEAFAFSPGAALGPADEWRLFHLLGATLRTEQKAL